MTTAGPNLGFVTIGRNEGDRLKRCIASLSSNAPVVYVDSGSTDGSPEWVKAAGTEVVQLDMRSEFTAARARNEGLRRLLEVAPNITYVQFVDGDCELVVCDLEWDTPIGESKAFGGDVMMRISAFQAVGGYRDDVVAGEDPELALRLRVANWKLFRLDLEMTLHDAAMTRFDQWWRRSMRSGYAFALGADLHGSSPERHWVWESRRAWIWGVWLPIFCVAAGLLFGAIGLVAWSVYPVQVMRQTLRVRGSFRDRMAVGFFQTLSRFPESWGQIKYHFDRSFSRRARLIEYK